MGKENEISRRVFIRDFVIITGLLAGGFTLLEISKWLSPEKITSCSLWLGGSTIRKIADYRFNSNTPGERKTIGSNKAILNNGNGEYFYGWDGAKIADIQNILEVRDKVMPLPCIPASVNLFIGTNDIYNSNDDLDITTDRLSSVISTINTIYGNPQINYILPYQAMSNYEERRIIFNTLASQKLNKFTNVRTIDVNSLTQTGGNWDPSAFRSDDDLSKPRHLNDTKLKELINIFQNGPRSELVKPLALSPGMSMDIFSRVNSTQVAIAA